jgi:hypothetical protein
MHWSRRPDKAKRLFRSSRNLLNGWYLTCSPRTFSPFYACRRLTLRSLVASLLATLRPDSESVGRPGIKLPCDR